MQLRLASDDEKRARDRLTFAEWGALLTLEQYLERERRLRAHPWSRAGMRTWLLVEGNEVLASCETFAMPGDVDGVASVFVAPELRGRGHASQLMKRLVEQLRSEGRLATLLFSDVGPELYERAGFVLRPALERHFAPQPGDPRNACDRVFGESDFARELADAPQPDDALLIWPDAAQLDWHLERERIYTALLGKARPFGARRGRRERARLLAARCAPRRAEDSPPRRAQC